MILLIILLFFFISTLGYVVHHKRFKRNKDNYDFANEFRENFISLANHYTHSYDSWNRKGNVDNEKYIWLTKNVNKMQGDIGAIGIMDLVAAFQNYQVKNYQILINTLPKFRDGSVQDFDINSSDDCLLRYLGTIEKNIKNNERNLRNPFIWFKSGFHEIMSIPILIFNWFGILSNRATNNIISSTIYKFFTGLTGLVTIISGIVTIIQGKEKTIEMINKLLGN